jgi:hypothetical protein
MKKHMHYPLSSRFSVTGHSYSQIIGQCTENRIPCWKFGSNFILPLNLYEVAHPSNPIIVFLSYLDMVLNRPAIGACLPRARTITPNSCLLNTNSLPPFINGGDLKPKYPHNPNPRCSPMHLIGPQAPFNC